MRNLLLAGNPAISYNFTVFIQMIPMGFTKISSIQYEIDTDFIKEGGVNNYVHTMMKPCQTEKRMVFERGVCSDLKTALTGRLNVGQRLNMPVLIFVSGADGIYTGFYELSGVIVKKFSSSDLDASRGALIIEKIELVYENIEFVGIKVNPTSLFK